MERLYEFSARTNGARMMLVRLYEQGYLYAPKDLHSLGKRDGAVYLKAIYDWLIEDLAHIDSFLKGCDIGFYGFEKDKKGKLIRCRAKEINN